MDLHFVDMRGNHFVVPDAPENYARDDANAIDPPPSPEHRWTNGEWQLPATPKHTLAKRRQELMSRLRQCWDEEEKGGTSALGWTVRTDAEGQARITGGIVAFTNDPTLGSVPYEMTPGVWLDLDEPTMCALGVIVAQHVKGCAARARVISEAIHAAATHAAMDAAEAEIAVGWAAWASN